MNLIILLIIAIMLYLIYVCNTVENLEDLTNHSNINASKKCCEIKKIVLPNNTFGYEYNIKENCRRDYNSNIRHIFENEIIDNQPFTLDKCNSDNKLIGSCRKIGFECMDFMTSQDCKKYQMKWSDKNCRDKLLLDIVYPDYKLTADLRTIIR
jgi:hypothetical protein